MPAGSAAARWTSGDMVVWLGVLLASAAVVVVGWWMLRRWLRKRADVSEEAPPWSLQQLRELKSAGQITDDEYARLAARMSAELKRRLR